MKGKKQRFLTFLGLPVDEKLLFLESLSLHLWVGFLMKFIPFKKLSVWFANPSGKQVVPSKDTLEKIKSAGIRASRVSPWKNKCLVSSLAIRYMLRRRKIESKLSLGVIKAERGKVVAHAWLVSGDTELVARSDDYTALFIF